MTTTQKTLHMNATELTNQLSALTAELASVRAEAQEGTDTLWLLLTGAMVFFMQCGFGMLEAGSVRSKATQSILLKNLFDASLGGLLWWLVGYGFANGEGGSFIGTTAPADAPGNYFATANLLANERLSGVAWASVFFQFPFAAAASTIVSGAIAERAQLRAYLVFSSVLCASELEPLRVGQREC